MKTELKALLNSKNATLKINNLFVLRRYIVKAEDDYLGRDLDSLQLEMYTDKYHYICSTNIESRTIPEIMEDVKNAMTTMMEEYKDELCRHWMGGYLENTEIKEF